MHARLVLHELPIETAVLQLVPWAVLVLLLLLLWPQVLALLITWL
jgi:hypothetical protein